MCLIVDQIRVRNVPFGTYKVFMRRNGYNLSGFELVGFKIKCGMWQNEISKSAALGQSLTYIRLVWYKSDYFISKCVTPFYVIVSAALQLFS